MRAGPLNGISPADPHFDPFWARANEAQIPVILHNLFGRFRDLQMLSVENGSTWVPSLLKDLDKTAMVTVSTQGEEIRI